ncbi:hypothetical protein [Alteromonas gracilis]|uniref:hypothetical protein n=1 Tax=Alteromonas gracilis TaxID=1479524 RepID=UPI003734F1CC
MPHFLPTAFIAIVFVHSPLCAQQNSSLNHNSKNSSAPTYFQDCTVLDFGEQDMSTMTEAEKIQALDDSFFGALNQSEDCMNAAAQSSAQSVASAAGQGAGAGNTSGGSSAGMGAGQSSTQSSTETQESSANTRTSTTTSNSSKQSVGGPAKGGSSAVCDAVIAGLEGATTESERAHFEALKEQYGCK